MRERERGDEAKWRSTKEIEKNGRIAMLNVPTIHNSNGTLDSDVYHKLTLNNFTSLQNLCAITAFNYAIKTMLHLKIMLIPLPFCESDTYQNVNTPWLKRLLERQFGSPP